MIKNGKKHISSRPAASPRIDLDEVFGNPLSIPPVIKKYLEEKKLAHRFISHVKLKATAGRHHRGWSPLSLKEVPGYDTMNTFGSSPDGYYYFGDLILAVRPQELNQKHKAYLKQEAQAASNTQRKGAEELRQYVKSNKLDMRVHEGYEEEEQE
jgi:hypothetical protein